MAVPDFSGVLAKINRADHHHREFRASVQASDPSGDLVGVDYEQSQSGRRHVFRIRFLRDFPLTEWALIMSDCIHNLRCALDHCAYLLAMAATSLPIPPSSERIAFPIADSADRFPRASRTDILADLRGRPDMVAAIEHFQPYNRPVPGNPPALTLLRELSNIDKHRMLPVAICKIHTHLGFDLRFPPLRSGQKVKWWCQTAPLTDGTEVFVVEFEDPVLDLEADMKGDFSAGFVHEPAPDGRIHSDVDWALPFIHDEVVLITSHLRTLLD